MASKVQGKLGRSAGGCGRQNGPIPRRPTATIHLDPNANRFADLSRWKPRQPRPHFRRKSRHFGPKRVVRTKQLRRHLSVWNVENVLPVATDSKGNRLRCSPALDKVPIVYTNNWGNLEYQQTLVFIERTFAGRPVHGETATRWDWPNWEQCAEITAVPSFKTMGSVQLSRLLTNLAMCKTTLS